MVLNVGRVIACMCDQCILICTVVAMYKCIASMCFEDTYPFSYIARNIEVVETVHSVMHIVVC